MLKDIHPVVRFFLSIRYTFGYLAASFLVSTPIQVVNQQDAALSDKWHIVLYSLGYGAVCAIIFALFIPISNVDWRKVPLLDYRRFELGVTRNAAILCAALVLFTFSTRALKWAFAEQAATVADEGGPTHWSVVWFETFYEQRNLAWLVFILSFFSYAKIKANAVLFKDYLGEEEKEFAPAGAPAAAEGAAPPPAPPVVPRAPAPPQRGEEPEPMPPTVALPAPASAPSRVPAQAPPPAPPPQPPPSPPPLVAETLVMPVPHMLVAATVEMAAPAVAAPEEAPAPELTPDDLDIRNAQTVIDLDLNAEAGAPAGAADDPRPS